MLRGLLFDCYCFVCMVKPRAVRRAASALARRGAAVYIEGRSAYVRTRHTAAPLLVAASVLSCSRGLAPSDWGARAVGLRRTRRLLDEQALGDLDEELIDILRLWRGGEEQQRAWCHWCVLRGHWEWVLGQPRQANVLTTLPKDSRSPCGRGTRQRRGGSALV